MTMGEGGPTALQVAIAAGIMLVGVVGADVALNRTVRLDVETEDGWRTLATLPPDRASYAPHGPVVEVNRSDEVRFRVAVDNQRLDGFEQSYEVRKDGQRVAQGTLAADALGEGHETFTVSGDTLLGQRGSGPQRPGPVVGSGLELVVDGETTHAWFEVEEVAG